jgi:hypothetical protein
MPREVDPRTTRKALRKLARAAARVEAAGAALSAWESEFVANVADRLTTYGSAFRDPAKGAPDAALSERQAHVVRLIDRKGRERLRAANSGEPPAPAPARDYPRAGRAGDGRSRRLSARRRPRNIAPDEGAAR